MKARGYPVPGADLRHVATLIDADLSRDAYDVRMFPTPPPRNGLVIEVRRAQGILQRGTGHAAVLKVWLTPTPIGFSAQVGTDRVGDAAAGAVEWLLATPALVTEGYAAFQQAQVDERILRVIDHRAANVARVPVHRAAAKTPEVGPCVTCRTPMPYGARFCPKCGHDTQSRVANAMAACPSCMGSVALDAVFCPHCGKNVAAAPTSKACVKCAASLERDAMFCSGRGSRQDA